MNTVLRIKTQKIVQSIKKDMLFVKGLSLPKLRAVFNVL